MQHIFILLLLFCESSAILFNKLVNTPSGRVEREILMFNEKPIARFLGIPYAQPPVCELRFKAPVPIEPWQAKLRAKKFRPGCIQYFPIPLPSMDNLPGLTEDCLYLNIWAPMDEDWKRKRTVMFFIHGGAFIISSSRLDYFDGLALAAEGNVIVITFDYRLGPMGFLYSGTEDAPGNMGLLDVVEALKWVRNNIESFGGDKDSITIFGQSSGGMTVGMLCVSPVTRGLFKRAIMQSCTPSNMDGQDNDRDFRVSRKLAESVGCAEDENSLRDRPEAVVECLRNVDAFVLAKTLLRVAPNESHPVYPRYGDGLLPKDPRRAIADGDFVAVDVLMGSMSGEGSPLITTSMKEVFGSFGEKDPQINLTFGESIIRKKFKQYPDPEAVVCQYLGDVEEEDFSKIRYEVFTSIGDYERLCPTVYTAERFARAGAKTYYYFFIHRPSNSVWAPWMLSVHFDETPFVFGYPLRHPENFTEKEKVLSWRMMKAWSSFAKTGRPSYGAWPLYSEENPYYQILDVNIRGIGCGLHQCNCDFFRNYFGF